MHKKLIAVLLIVLCLALLYSTVFPLVYATTTVDTLVPTAAGTYTQLTPSGGTNWGCASVNDTDSTYNYDPNQNALPAIDTYNLNNTGDMTIVNSIIVSIVVRSEDSTYKVSFYTTLLVNNTLYYGASHSPSTSYVVYNDTWNTNPNTTSAWKGSDLDSLQVGVKTSNRYQAKFDIYWSGYLTYEIVYVDFISGGNNYIVDTTLSSSVAFTESLIANYKLSSPFSQATSFSVSLQAGYNLISSFSPSVTITEYQKTINITGTISAGYIFSGDYGFDYENARNSGGTTVYDARGYVLVENGFGGGVYAVMRGYYYFDTDSLLGASITSAGVWLFGFDETWQGFNITFQNGQPIYPHDPLVLGDFAYGNYSGSSGEWNTTNLVLGAYNWIPFNATGISWINTDGGDTKLCMRHMDDINDIAPTRIEYVAFNSSGTSVVPLLQVTVIASLVQVDFHVVSQFAPLIAFLLDVISSAVTHFIVDLSFAASNSFIVALQSAFNIVSSFPSSASFDSILNAAYSIAISFVSSVGFVLDVLHTISGVIVNYIIDLIFIPNVTFVIPKTSNSAAVFAATMILLFILVPSILILVVVKRRRR